MSETFLETIRAVDGKVYNLSYHQQRYEDVLKSFGSSDFKNLQDYLNPPVTGLYRCRLIYDTRNIDVTYHKYEKREVASLRLVYDDSVDYSRKSTYRNELESLFEKREECDDILIIKNSLITDTSIANVAFYNSGLWYTPLKPLLRGTTRQRLLDENKIIEKEIRIQDLKEYSKIALMNAMIDFDIITKYDLKDIIC
ncbi:aminotransferase class IV family protein [Sulfurimonas sp.]|uniref:aminotransferase class IV family protein n=1 Tax=Sulfurimonas sp. TaxID=2022749 RepID=UPI0035681B28